MSFSGETGQNYRSTLGATMDQPRTAVPPSWNGLVRLSEHESIRLVHTSQSSTSG